MKIFGFLKGKKKRSKGKEDTINARYFFEHQVLRDEFYSNTAQLINSILQKDGVYDFSCFVADYEGYDNPYKKGDFRIDALRWNAEINLISIECPAPIYSPLCYRIYLLFSDCFENLGYYTVECGASHNAFLCGWDDSGNHSNFREMTSANWTDDTKGLQKSIEAEVIIKLHADINNLNDEHD